MRKLLLIALVLLPACGGGGNDPTPVTQPPAPPATTLAPAPPPPSVPSISGTWDSQARRWHFRLGQSGSNVTGQLLGYANVYYPNPTQNGNLTIRGTISSNGNITFGCNSDGVSFTGRVESSTRMTGTSYDCANGCRTYGEILVRTGN